MLSRVSSLSLSERDVLPDWKDHVFSLVLNSYQFWGIFCKCKHFLWAKFAAKYFQGLHQVHTKSCCLFSLAFSCELQFSLFPVLLAVAARAVLVYTGGGRGKKREDGIGHQKGTAQSRPEYDQILCSIPPSPVTSPQGFSFNFLLDLACLSHCSMLLRYLNFRCYYTE